MGKTNHYEQGYRQGGGGGGGGGGGASKLMLLCVQALTT